MKAVTPSMVGCRVCGARPGEPCEPMTRHGVKSMRVARDAQAVVTGYHKARREAFRMWLITKGAGDAR